MFDRVFALAFGHGAEFQPVFAIDFEFLAGTAEVAQQDSMFGDFDAHREPRFQAHLVAVLGRQ